MTASGDEPDYMLAELTREHDGAVCRIEGDISKGTWDARISCEGMVLDSASLVPTAYGFLHGKLTYYDETWPQVARVLYCPYSGDEVDFDDCHEAGWSDADGTYRVLAKPSRWFVTFSVFDNGDWEYCAEGYEDDDDYLGKKVTVRLAQSTKVSMDCPWFKGLD